MQHRTISIVRTVGYKKSELMLMTRARVYSSSCLQYNRGLSPFILSQFTLCSKKLPTNY